LIYFLNANKSLNHKNNSQAAIFPLPIPGNCDKWTELFKDILNVMDLPSSPVYLKVIGMG
jgi:hypothetical protein